MPKRTDIHSVLIIGAGPIIIGQACEFDYSGTQACKALKEEGFRVVLVNSNPATIMTDPEFADRTYIEPITPECIEKIIVRELDEMKKMGVPASSSVAASRKSADKSANHVRDKSRTNLCCYPRSAARRRSTRPWPCSAAACWRNTASK